MHTVEFPRVVWTTRHFARKVINALDSRDGAFNARRVEDRALDLFDASLRVQRLRLADQYPQVRAFLLE
jgi:hypothetical protein